MTGIDSSSVPILMPGPFSSVLVVCMGAGFRCTRGQVSEEARGVRSSNHLEFVLGAKLRSFARAVDATNH